MSKIKKSLIKMPPRSDKWIHFCTIALSLFGLIMVISASMGSSSSASSLYKVGFKQILYISAGYAFMVFMANHFNFEFVKKNIFRICVIMGGFLVFALFFKEVGGARAWIRIPLPGLEVTLQPSEFSKIVCILVVAVYLADIKVQKIDCAALLKMPTSIIAAFCFIVLVLQSDFGSFAVMTAISGILFLIPSHPSLRKIQRIALIVMTVGLVSLVWIMTPMGMHMLEKLPLLQYQISRFQSAMNPFIDKYDTGFQLIAGLAAFSKGGWFGVGLGNSLMKYTRFPAANTDFILAIVVEEFGFMGFLFITICYGIIMFHLISYALKMKSERGKVVLFGVALYLFIHFLFNAGGVSGLIPLTGIPLLMISSGGSSTMAIMLSLGICQAIISQFRRGLIE